ncbi:hypothetical protein EYF80_029237 [Liparis tanakae]|uniref:Uncharacterized protein n=1 Tax=Liparis tanakae TaxID=230148 RepID=A0A4Z2H6S4_9TELE|nr:hypothetical protein EYF80_029237 [Liparis tanakae]
MDGPVGGPWGVRGWSDGGSVGGPCCEEHKGIDVEAGHRNLQNRFLQTAGCGTERLWEVARPAGREVGRGDAAPCEGSPWGPGAGSRVGRAAAGCCQP